MVAGGPVPAPRVAVELQARRTVVETHRQLTQNIRVIRGCPRQARAHHVLQSIPRVRVNDSG